MKKYLFIISIIFVLIIVLLISVFIYNILFKNVYYMDEKMFDISNITNVTIKNNEKNFDIDNNDDIKELLNVIKGNNRKTRKQSVNDAPNGEKMICVDINYIDNSYKRIYAYKYINYYYLELPYEGVYKLSKNDYNLINNFIK